MVEECVIIQLGQCGVQSGFRLWELLCHEHDIDYDGKLKVPKEDLCFKTFFKEIYNGTSDETSFYTPRTAFYDTDPVPIETIQQSKFKNLFDSKTFWKGKESASGLYGRGTHIGHKHLHKMEDFFRADVESCERFSSVVKLSSNLGGTGSGVSTVLCKYIKDHYKGTFVNYELGFSDKCVGSTVEPYNALLAIAEQDDIWNMVINLDNQGLYDYWTRTGNDAPQFYDLNYVQAAYFQCLTTYSRFPTELDAHLSNLATNLVPWPSMNQVIPYMNPLKFKEPKLKNLLHNGDLLDLSIYNPKNRLVHCFEDPRLEPPTVISGALLARGNISIYDLHKYYIPSSNNVYKPQFVSWTHGMKIAHSSEGPRFSPDSPFAPQDKMFCTLINSTAFATKLNTLKKRVKLLMNKKSFLFWYESTGYDKKIINETRETLNIIIEAYNLADIEYHAENPTPQPKKKSTSPAGNKFLHAKKSELPAQEKETPTQEEQTPAQEEQTPEEDH